MERLIAAEIHEHLRYNGLLSGAQYGFIKGKSTRTNLLECITDWTITLQNKKSVTVAYIDFKKASGTVSHEKLFHVCIHMAYGVLCCCGLTTFTNRTHQTRIGWSSRQ